MSSLIKHINTDTILAVAVMGVILFTLYIKGCLVYLGIALISIWGLSAILFVVGFLVLFLKSYMNKYTQS